MTDIIRYTLRADSVPALTMQMWQAQQGKSFELVTYGNGSLIIAGNLVEYPQPEMIDGEPYEDDEGVMITPQEPTGKWIATVCLTHSDGDLEALDVGN